MGGTGGWSDRKIWGSSKYVNWQNHAVGRGCLGVWGFLWGGYGGGGATDKKEEVICFGSYNIRNGQNGGLD